MVGEGVHCDAGSGNAHLQMRVLRFQRRPLLQHEVGGDDVVQNPDSRHLIPLTSPLTRRATGGRRAAQAGKVKWMGG